MMVHSETETKRARGEYDPAPCVEVLGKLESDYAIRVAWGPGVHSVSPERLKFLRELNMEVVHDTDVMSY